MPKLSDTQAVLLSAAAARPDMSLLPIPDTIRLPGAALNRTFKSLLPRGFIAENAIVDRARRTKGTGSQLVITPAVLAAIGIEARHVERERPKGAPNAGQQTDHSTRPGRPGGKLGVVLDAVAASNKATLDELTTASGWLPHTTRAALTRLRQRGFDVRLAPVSDVRKAYHLVPAT